MNGLPLEYYSVQYNIASMIQDSPTKSKLAAQTAPSQGSSSLCEIKSKYLGVWDQRSLKISLQSDTLELQSKSYQPKRYKISQVRFQEDPKSQNIYLIVPGGRKYQIKVNQHINQTLELIEYFMRYQQLQFVVLEQSVPVPQNLNYFATVMARSSMEDFVPSHNNKFGERISEKVILENYGRAQSYIKEEDWRRDEKRGGVVFINSDKKSIISKMITFIVKRVISTGSFMGISFPTFAMKPQTILQTYCRCLGTAPIILENIPSDPVSRMKAFNAIILTLSLQFNDIEKPFNPTIGETFQGEIGGYHVYAEQISHHPPVSSFYLDGKDYVLYGTLELNANLGLNSAIGIFYGEVTLEFDDGGVVKGRMPSGMLNGMVFGETRFGPDGAVYSYDLKNKLVTTYEFKQGRLRGYIGKLKPKVYDKFTAMLQIAGKQKYENFKAHKESEYEKVFSKLDALWTSYIKYDGKMYFDYLRVENQPYALTQNIEGEKILPSDSSLRLDTKLRGEMKLQESQDEKQRIEEEERSLRKLREKYQKLKQQA